jgi:hypothetical protein
MSDNLTPTHAGPKPFGWEVDVEFAPASGKKPQTFHWRGCTERAARTKAILKLHAQRITEVRPVNEEQWMRAYGMGRL